MRASALALLAACAPPLPALVARAPLGGGAVAGFAIAVDGQGDGVVGWMEDGEVVVVDGPDAPRTLSEADEDAAAQLDVAAGPDGDALAAWQTTDPTTGAQAVRFAGRDGGGGWSAPATASWGDVAYEPRVAVGPDGDRALLWNQWTGAHYGVALATAVGADDAFDLPADADDVLSLPVFFSNAPRVAAGPGGALLVTWYQAWEADLRVWASERADRATPMSRPSPGSWLSPDGGAVASDPRSNPKPALGPDGRAAIAWVQEDAAGHAAVYVATRDGGRWTKPGTLDDAVSARGGVARHVELAFGAAGDLFVVWEEDGVVRLAVRDAAGGGWSAPRRLGALGARTLDPHVAAGVDGLVVVTFRALADDGDAVEVLRLRSGDADGPIARTRIAAAGPDAPRVAVGGPSDRVLVGFVDRGADGAWLRLVDGG